MAAEGGKQSVTALGRRTLYAPIAVRQESHVLTCMYDFSDLTGLAIQYDRFLFTEKSHSPEDHQKRQSPLSDFNRHPNLLWFCRYITGLEDRMESMEALLKKVSPLSL